jgi:hypothetical protein
MPKYIIEGSIDFFSELYKSLDEEEDNFKSEKDEQMCLITKQPLIEKFVTMKCGHKFNYIPLFKDIENHKKKFNSMESISGKSGKNEIRCPYCRKRQNELLPYYEDMKIPKVFGVNEIHPLQEKNYTSSCCQYNVDSYSCHSSGSQINEYINGEYINYGDTKNYCWTHKKQMIKKYKKDILDKAKQDSLQAKLKIKEEAKKVKEEAKEAKLKEKQEKKELKNVVLGPSNVEVEEPLNTGCMVLLKTGQNKGKPCGCNIFSESEKLCKRHYSIKYKTIVQTIVEETV